MKKLALLLYIAITITSCATAPKNQNNGIVRFNVKDIPAPTSPYSMAVWAGNSLYVSGQLGTDPITGQMPEDGFTGEVHGVMKNIERILKAAGLDFSNVVKSTVYLTDIKDFTSMNDIYKTYFKSGQYPARETVQVAALARGAHIEISVVAYKPN